MRYISPSKRAIGTYNPQGLFSEFYGISNQRIRLSLENVLFEKIIVVKESENKPFQTFIDI